MQQEQAMHRDDVFGRIDALGIISTESAYTEALRLIDALLDLTRQDSADEAAADALDALAAAVARYEEATDPLPVPTPAHIVRYYMDNRPNGRKELEELVGGKSRASELLNGKREPSLKQAQALRHAWGIPYDLLFDGITPGPVIEDLSVLTLRIPQSSLLYRKLEAMANRFGQPVESYALTALALGLGEAAEEDLRRELVEFKVPDYRPLGFETYLLEDEEDTELVV